MPAAQQDGRERRLRAATPRQGAFLQQPPRPRQHALAIVRDFGNPAAVVIKHNNPCGAAEAEHAWPIALAKAMAGDPLERLRLRAGTQSRGRCGHGPSAHRAGPVR